MFLLYLLYFLNYSLYLFELVAELFVLCADLFVLFVFLLNCLNYLYYWFLNCWFIFAASVPVTFGAEQQYAFSFVWPTGKPAP